MKINETTIDGIDFLLIEESDGMYIETPFDGSRTPVCLNNGELSLEDGFYNRVDGMSETIEDVLFTFESALNK